MQRQSIDLSLQPFTREQLPSVQELHIASLRELCHQHYTAAQILAHEDIINADDYGDILLESRINLVFSADHLVATIGWCPHAENIARVRKVFVHPDRAGQGLGQRLMGLIEKEIIAAGYKEMILHASLNAIPFYEKFGFTAIRLTHMENSQGVKISAMIMRKLCCLEKDAKSFSS